MIHATVETDGGTLVIDLPRSIYDLYEKLNFIGIRCGPKNILLTDIEDQDIRVKFHADTQLEGHLLHVLDEHDSLQDANLLIHQVKNASRNIWEELNQKILCDTYMGVEEAIKDIAQMTYDSGPVKAVFYCPLTGNIDEGDGDIFTVGNSYLEDYQWAIEEAIEKDFAGDEHNIAEYFDEDPAISQKLASMNWSVEKYRGHLFGRIECSLKAELTEAETEVMKEWITGQNSDGWGEHFEQQPIDTEDGDLYVSFRHGGNDYSIMAHDELDEYIENQGMKMGGM